MRDLSAPGLSPLLATSAATLAFIAIPRFSLRPAMAVAMDAMIFAALLLGGWMILRARGATVLR